MAKSSVAAHPIAPANPTEDAKSRILGEATRLFASRGFEATSIQAIAEAAGMRKQSLLYHFASKEELHRQVIEASLVHWRDALPRMLAQKTGDDRFKSIITELLAYFRADRNRARLTLREMLDRPEAFRARLQEVLSPLIRLLSDYIRMGQASGIVKAEVHAESYIVQVTMMAISTVAIGGVASGLVGETSEPQMEELVRIAREALFAPGADATAKG